MISETIVASFVFGFVGSGDPAQSGAPGSAQSDVSVLAYGAVPNDGQDDTAAIQAAFNSGNDIFFPDGTYEVSSNIHTSKLMKERTIRSQIPRKAVLRTTSNAQLSLGYFHRFDGFTLDGVRLVLNGYSDNDNARRIKGNRFINIASNHHTIWLGHVADPVRNLTVEDNEFFGGASGVNGSANGCYFIGNRFDLVVRALQFRSCMDSVIQGNSTVGGVVGILFLPKFPHISEGFIGNSIIGNQVTGASEEGISLDAGAGNSEGSYLRWTSTVASREAAGSAVGRVFMSNAPDDPSDLIGGYMVFLDDGSEVKGHGSGIAGVGTANGKWYCDLSEGPDYASCLPGQRFVILKYLFADNYIAGNTVTGIGLTGIGLHGAGFLTVIENNTVQDCNPYNIVWGGGIVLRNLVGAAATMGRHGPVFYNTVVGNRLSGVHSGLKAMNQVYQSSYIFKAIGNVQDGNVFENGADLVWTDQYRAGEIEAAALVEFSADEGYANGALNGQKNWTATSGVLVADAAGSGSLRRDTSGPKTATLDAGLLPASEGTHYGLTSFVSLKPDASNKWLCMNEFVAGNNAVRVYLRRASEDQFQFHLSQEGGSGSKSSGFITAAQLGIGSDGFTDVLRFVLELNHEPGSTDWTVSGTLFRPETGEFLAGWTGETFSQTASFSGGVLMPQLKMNASATEFTIHSVEYGNK